MRRYIYLINVVESVTIIVENIFNLESLNQNDFIHWLESRISQFIKFFISKDKTEFKNQEY